MCIICLCLAVFNMNGCSGLRFRKLINSGKDQETAPYLCVTQPEKLFFFFFLQPFALVYLDFRGVVHRVVLRALYSSFTRRIPIWFNICIQFYVHGKLLLRHLERNHGKRRGIPIFKGNLCSSCVGLLQVFNTLWGVTPEELTGYNHSFGKGVCSPLYFGCLLYEW